MKTRKCMSPPGRPKGEYRSAQHKGHTVRRWLRRSSWEQVTGGLIGLGLVMLMQPWSMEAYSYSFIVLLAGVVGYSIAGQLPQDAGPPRSLRSLPPEGAPASSRRLSGGS